MNAPYDVDAQSTLLATMQRVEALEAKLAALFAYMRDETQRAGLAGPQKAAPSRPHLSVVRS